MHVASAVGRRLCSAFTIYFMKIVAILQNVFLNKYWSKKCDISRKSMHFEKSSQFYLQVSSDRINSQNFKPLCHALIHNFVPILFPFFDGLMIIQIMVNQGFVAYRSAFWRLRKFISGWLGGVVSQPTFSIKHLKNYLCCCSNWWADTALASNFKDFDTPYYVSYGKLKFKFYW